ncbi:chloramphenicol phosphotransferase CPT family protein [Streptomyces sp. NPDC058008]|uniref:chloramphenicol phosphotransferase CPT family protein n=1 Tax=Streptomyces sp. NPDC058008 TaxID=3346303 RepID=UPI0036E212C2
MGASVQYDRPGHVIFLNGTSSAGKTTLARAIQEESDEPYLYWGIDTLFSMVPEKWAGGRGGLLSFEGFRYDRSEQDEDGRQLISIRYGNVGRRILAAACASVAKLALKGCNVVVDEMLLSPDLLEDWFQALSGVEVYLVGVYCPVHVLEEREAARGNPAGLARGHLRTVHAHEARYDLKVDTSKIPAQELARTVLRAHSLAVAEGRLGGGLPR